MEGYTIVDESGRELETEELGDDELEKLVLDGEPVVASEIPKDELTVIIDGSGVSTVPDEFLEIFITQDGGYVEHNGKRVGSFKSAFIAKLKSERSGYYVRAKMFSSSAPLMVKLTFFKTKVKNSTKIQ